MSRITEADTHASPPTAVRVLSWRALKAAGLTEIVVAVFAKVTGASGWLVASAIVLTGIASLLLTIWYTPKCPVPPLDLVEEEDRRREIAYREWVFAYGSHYFSRRTAQHFRAADQRAHKN